MQAGSQALTNSSSPDRNAAGLVQGDVRALRYDTHHVDPHEVAGIVVDFVPRGARVLDVGCGTGLLGKILSDICAAVVVGIEPDIDRAELSRKRGVETRVGYFSRDLVNDIGAFDVVLFADVLEHLPNPLEALLLSREVLRGGGVVIVSLPNVAHWSVRLDVARGRFRYQPSGIMDATHLRWFTAASAKALLSSAGFNVIGYRATAGTDVPDNICRMPLCWVPEGFRSPFLRTASKHWPTLFGAQHVMKGKAS